MKKSLKLLIFTLVMITMLALSVSTAWAAEFDHCAEALQAMGLFQGSESGYALDRQATRAEAAVMLVRLLGAEEEALSGAYSHPFTDVAEWASPYIAYMYDNGLTKGVSATTFNPQGVCDLQMYSAFVLRALGYEEAAGDFSYASATELAMQLGVVDILTGVGDFKRDNLAAISYTALFAPIKGAQTTLLEQLIEKGAVDAAAAQPYLELYATYADIQTATAKQAKMGEAPMEMKLDMAMKMDMGSEGAMTMTFDSLIGLDAAGISDAATLTDVLAALNKIKLSMTGKIAVSGSGALASEDVNLTLDLYLLDGVCYLNTNLGELLGTESIPAQMKLSMEEAMGMLDLDGLDLALSMLDTGSVITSLVPINPYTPHYGIATIKAIQSESLADGSQRYDISFVNIPNDLIQSLIRMMYSGMPEIAEATADIGVFCSIDKCLYTIDKDGNMKAQDITVSVAQTMFAGTAEEVTVHMEMQISYELTKTGSEVTFTLPGQAADYINVFELLGSSMEEPL